MRTRYQHDIGVGVHLREPSEASNEPVYDVKAFARTFILVGIAAGCVRVRRKSDGADGTLHFASPPLHFYDFVPDLRHKSPPTRWRPRA